MRAFHKKLEPGCRNLLQWRKRIISRVRQWCVSWLAVPVKPTTHSCLKCALCCSIKDAVWSFVVNKKKKKVSNQCLSLKCILCALKVSQTCWTDFWNIWNSALFTSGFASLQAHACFRRSIATSVMSYRSYLSISGLMWNRQQCRLHCLHACTSCVIQTC